MVLSHLCCCSNVSFDPVCGILDPAVDQRRLSSAASRCRVEAGEEKSGGSQVGDRLLRCPVPSVDICELGWFKICSPSCCCLVKLLLLESLHAHTDTHTAHASPRPCFQAGRGENHAQAFKNLFSPSRPGAVKRWPCVSRLGVFLLRAGPAHSMTTSGNQSSLCVHLLEAAAMVWTFAAPGRWDQPGLVDAVRWKLVLQPKLLITAASALQERVLLIWYFTQIFFFVAFPPHTDTK